MAYTDQQIRNALDKIGDLETRIKELEKECKALRTASNNHVKLINHISSSISSVKSNAQNLLQRINQIASAISRRQP